MPEPTNAGAPTATPGQPTTTPAQPTTMEVAGRKVVFESDLIAAKESLKKQLDDQQAVHSAAMDKAKLDLSAAQQEVASASAKLKELTANAQKGASAAVDPAELARLKTAAEAANKELGDWKQKHQDLRISMMSTLYKLPPDTLKGKSAEQLDAIEVAVKALGGTGGVGNYATGAGGGGTPPATPMDRARQVIAATPVRGIRNEPQQK